jgi:hypothetical protein
VPFVKFKSETILTAAKTLYYKHFQNSIDFSRSYIRMTNLQRIDIVTHNNNKLIFCLCTITENSQMLATYETMHRANATVVIL